MKKLIYIGMMCVFALTAFAQEPEQIDLGPYGTLVVRTNKKPIEYFETQMKLWEKKVKQNKKDANAWLNYFAATKCAWLIEEIKKGNLNAKQFADFHDFKAKNDYYCQWSLMQINKNVTEEEVNKRRAEIGLGTHEQRMREQKNFINSRGKEYNNDPKPYVKIIY